MSGWRIQSPQEAKEGTNQPGLKGVEWVEQGGRTLQLGLDGAQGLAEGDVARCGAGPRVMSVFPTERPQGVSCRLQAGQSSGATWVLQRWQSQGSDTALALRDLWWAIWVVTVLQLGPLAFIISIKLQHEELPSPAMLHFYIAIFTKSDLQA